MMAETEAQQRAEFERRIAVLRKVQVNQTLLDVETGALCRVVEVSQNSVIAEIIRHPTRGGKQHGKT